MHNTFGLNIIPDNEEERSNALRRYKVVDTPSEDSFDNVAKLAAKIFNVPISLVSLVDSEEVFFKANVGMGNAKIVPRGVSLCSLVILKDEVTVFENAGTEPCLLSNPNVAGKFGLKFYAGAPLITHDGFRIGTICIIDKHPRKFTKDDEAILQGLANVVMDEIELRLSSIQQIEELVEASKLLELSQNNLSKMIMQAPVAMCILRGPEFKIEIANTKMFEFWGIGNENLNSPVFEKLPHLSNDFEPLLNDVFYEDKTIRLEEVKTQLFRDGNLESAYVNFSYQPIRELNKTTSGILAVATDVTSQVLSRQKIERAELTSQELIEELAAANEELNFANNELTATNEKIAVTNEELKSAHNNVQVSEERFKLAIENSESGVFDTNLKTQRTNRSLKHAQIYGYPDNSKDWTPKDFKRHIFPDDYKQVKYNYLKSFKSGIFNESFRILRNDGFLRWITTQGKLIYNDKNEAIRIVGTIIDITEKKELEKQKDEFISTVSHELKTPVTSIKAYAQVLQRTLIGEGNAKNKNFLERMDIQINRLENLIIDLLDTTRIESGKLIINQAIVDMGMLLKEHISDLQLVNTSHKLIITENTEVTVRADKERLIQVITNFITNAVKYSPLAQNVKIGLTVNGDKMICAITDFGKGIPPEEYQTVFERFHQVNRSDMNLGLGLGLYISKEIIVRQGGEIWFESKVNEGSTFYFSLPVYKI